MAHCKQCGQVITRTKKNVIYCSQYCNKKASHQRQKKVVEEATKGFPPLETHKQYRCPTCGATVNHKPPCYACKLKHGHNIPNHAPCN